ncbi:MAG: hypothetical protein PHX43_03015 [Alphaproteobacteria bacterium]|nr:hypothetical protein [Alphaproteobacteria bacterium]
MSQKVLKSIPNEKQAKNDVDIIVIITDIVQKLSTICLMLKYFGWKEPLFHIEAARNSLVKLAGDSETEQATQE